MTLTDAPTAVIAEDEPVLARTLRRLLEQVWPAAQVDWSGKVLVNYRAGRRRLATVVTKRPAGIDLEVFVPTQSVALGAITGLGEDPEVRPGPDASDIISLRFTTQRQIEQAELRRFLTSLAQG